jgi:hypothetical protein
MWVVYSATKCRRNNISFVTSFRYQKLGSISKELTKDGWPHFTVKNSHAKTIFFYCSLTQLSWFYLLHTCTKWHHNHRYAALHCDTWTYSFCLVLHTTYAISGIYVCKHLGFQARDGIASPCVNKTGLIAIDDCLLTNRSIAGENEWEPFCSFTAQKIGENSDKPKTLVFFFHFYILYAVGEKKVFTRFPFDSLRSVCFSCQSNKLTFQTRGLHM